MLPGDFQRDAITHITVGHLEPPHQGPRLGFPDGELVEGFSEPRVPVIHVQHRDR